MTDAFHAGFDASIGTFGRGTRLSGTTFGAYGGCPCAHPHVCRDRAALLRESSRFDPQAVHKGLHPVQAGDRVFATGRHARTVTAESLARPYAAIPLREPPRADATCERCDLWYRLMRAGARSLTCARDACIRL